MTSPTRFVALSLGVVTICALAFIRGAGADEPNEAPRYDLSIAPGVGELEQVSVHLEVGGEVSLREDGAVHKLPTSVAADLHYSQRLLAHVDAVTASGLRHYDKADLTIKVDKGGVQPKLRDNRRLIVVETGDGELNMFSPQGMLTRDELDLVDVLGDRLALGGLLPSKSVAQGESWTVTDECLRTLLGLEAIAQSDVTGMISDVRENRVKVMLGGRIDGAISGVATEMELKAAFLFELTHKRITRFEMLLNEKREISLVGPGLDVTARVRVDAAPLAESDALSDKAIAGLDLAPKSAERRLYEASPRGEFAWTYQPDWYITSETPELIVMRLVQRGDLIAQANLTPLPEQSLDELTTMEEFQKDIRFVLGEKFGEFIGVGAWNDSYGQRVFRVVAAGHVEDLPIEWRYYLVANRQGRRVAVAFTVEDSLIEKLGDADRQIVDSLRLATSEKPVAETARTPKPAAK